VDVSENILYIRSNNPLPGSHPLNSDLVEDAQLLLQIDDPVLVDISNQLEKQVGFIRSDEIRKVVSARVKNADNSKRVARLLIALSERLIEDENFLEKLKTSLSKWWEPDDDDDDPPTPEQQNVIFHRLDLIVKPYYGLRMQVHADKLSKLIRRRFTHLDIINDLRPIFDLSTPNLSAVLPLTTIRVVFEMEDGLPQSIEGTITETGLKELSEKIDIALSQLNALNKYAAGQGLLIPSVNVHKHED
jgi:hypothetical protein